MAGRRASPAHLRPAVLAVIASVLVGCAGSGSGGGAPVSVGPARQAVVLAYGHSYVSGVPGQPPPWPTVLASDLRLPLVDLGHGGDVATRCLSRMASAAEHPADGDVVVWECDLNDVRRYGADAGHLETFRKAFASALARMGHGRVVVVEDPPITGWGLYPPFNHGSVAALDRYNAVIERSAPPSVHVVKVLGWDPTTMLARDAVHPNDAGKRAIASTVAAAVRSIG